MTDSERLQLMEVQDRVDVLSLQMQKLVKLLSEMLATEAQLKSDFEAVARVALATDVDVQRLEAVIKRHTSLLNASGAGDK